VSALSGGGKRDPKLGAPYDPGEKATGFFQSGGRKKKINLKSKKNKNLEKKYYRKFNLGSLVQGDGKTEVKLGGKGRTKFSKRLGIAKR